MCIQLVNFINPQYFYNINYCTLKMNFQDLSDKLSCPYNKNHIFDKEKYMFHLNRCKDKEKVGHLFTSCQYNRVHIVPKQDLQSHQILCPDKDDIRKLTSQLKETLAEVDRQRQRSRQKNIKKQQLREDSIKRQIKLQHASDYILYQQCPLCRKIVQKLDQIKKVVPQEVLTKIKTLEKMIKMNNQLIKAQEELRKDKLKKQNI